MDGRTPTQRFTTRPEPTRVRRLADWSPSRAREHDPDTKTAEPTPAPIARPADDPDEGRGLWPLLGLALYAACSLAALAAWTLVAS